MDITYVAWAGLVVAIVALIMIWQLRSSLKPAEEAAPAPKKAAPAKAAAPAPKADNGAVVAAIAAAIAAMGGGEIVSIRPAARTGWTAAARYAGVQTNQQF